MKNVIGKLIDKIGINLVAYIASEPATKIVKSWAEGTVTPNIDQMELLVVTNMIVDEFAERESEDLARTFLMGTMTLGDEHMAPAKALRLGHTNEVMAHKNRVLNGEWD